MSRDAEVYQQEWQAWVRRALRDWRALHLYRVEYFPKVCRQCYQHPWRFTGHCDNPHRILTVCLCFCSCQQVDCISLRLKSVGSIVTVSRPFTIVYADDNSFHDAGPQQKTAPSAIASLWAVIMTNTQTFNFPSASFLIPFPMSLFVPSVTFFHT